MKLIKSGRYDLMFKDLVQYVIKSPEIMLLIGISVSLIDLQYRS